MNKTSAARGYFSSARIAVIAAFAALAGVLYVLNFSIPFAFPSFLEFRFSDIPILIGTFALGPASGAIIVVAHILVKLCIKGTSTVFVGELSDLLTCCAFAVTAGIIYAKNRSFKGALVAMAVGTAAQVGVALVANRFIIVPFFAECYGWDAIISMMSALFPACTRENFYNYYLWASVLPFNLMRCLVAVAVTLPIYKRISVMINRLNAKLSPGNDENGQRLRRINLISAIAAIAVIAVLVLFALLQFFVFQK